MNPDGRGGSAAPGDGMAGPAAAGLLTVGSGADEDWALPADLNELESTIFDELSEGRQGDVTDGEDSPWRVYEEAYKDQLVSLRVGNGVSILVGTTVEYWLQKYFEGAGSASMSDLWDREWYTQRPAHVRGTVLRCWHEAVTRRDYRVCVLPDGGVYFAGRPFLQTPLNRGRMLRTEIGHAFDWPSPEFGRSVRVSPWESVGDVVSLMGRALEKSSYFQRPAAIVAKEDVSVVDYVRRGNVMRRSKDAGWAPPQFRALAEFGEWEREALERCLQIRFGTVMYWRNGEAVWSVGALASVVAGSFSLEGGEFRHIPVGGPRGRCEQHWTVRCQVCGEGLKLMSRLEPAQGPRQMTLKKLAYWGLGYNEMIPSCGPCVPDVLVGHVRAGARTHQHGAYVNCMTAVMGVIGGGRAPRHLCRGNVSVHVSRLAGDVVPSRARGGAPYPTRRDVQRHFGEARGLAVLLMRHVDDGRVGFWKHDVDGGCSHFVPVRPSDVRVGDRSGCGLSWS